MAALFKYLAGVTVVLLAVVVVSAMTMSEMFLGFPVVAKAPATETPRWSEERLKAKADTKIFRGGSLSPLYPATPGKELLAIPVYAANAKRTNVRQALQLHRLPLQLFPNRAQHSNFPQQSLSFAETRSSFTRTRMVSGHEIY